MTTTFSRRTLLLAPLRYASAFLFVGMLLTFGALSPKFFAASNFANILIQSSSLGIVAVGMTFALLIAGIDLSVGSIMFLSAVIAGRMTLGGHPLWLALAAVLLTGLAFGAVNAALITKFKVVAFIVTLATLYVGRGLGLTLSRTRAMNLPEDILRLGAGTFLGVPLPIVAFACVALAGHLALRGTSFGRQIYAVGNNREAARNAGINADRITFAVYLISGLCAALGGVVSVAQLGAVSPTFGTNREFTAVAAVVLGGTSLFGGKGNILPGTVLGVLMLQTVENGLTIVNADPYLYPLVIGAIIFFAVLVDSLRHAHLRKIGRRSIRVEEGT